MPTNPSIKEQTLPFEGCALYDLVGVEMSKAFILPILKLLQKLDNDVSEVL